VRLKRIAKQLKREATAHPTKAALLGLLAVVALWFWAPLVWGWIAEDDQTIGAVVTEPAAESPAAPSPPTSAGARTTSKQSDAPQHPWQQLVQWMDSDPRTSAAQAVPEIRDPFVGCKTEVAERLPEEETEKVQVEVTPQSLGMTLSSTIVGPRRRVALINGKTYRQGQTVTATRDGQEYVFTLTEVHPRRIVLRYQAKQFELIIPSPAGSAQIELVKTAN
jgi:hypothetical protein